MCQFIFKGCNRYVYVFQLPADQVLMTDAVLSRVRIFLLKMRIVTLYVRVKRKLYAVYLVHNTISLMQR